MRIRFRNISSLRAEEGQLDALVLIFANGDVLSDFRWDEEQGEEGLYLLEVNTQPGMTPLSLVPEQARQRGIEYGELVERLIAEALDDAAENARALEGAAG